MEPTFLDLFLEAHINYIIKELGARAGIQYEQVISQKLNSKINAHHTMTFSDSGLNEPTGFQLDVVGNYSTGKISIYLVYLDAMFSSLNTEQLNKLANCFSSIEKYLNEAYEQRRMKGKSEKK